MKLNGRFLGSRLAILASASGVVLLLLWLRRRRSRQSQRRVLTRGEISAGLDFLQTAPRGAVFHFEHIPIPPGFFTVRSAAFAKTVTFRGRPLSHRFFDGQHITHVDTIVERKHSVKLPPPYPRAQTIPIELIGLALESVDPIEVPVGDRTELWDVQVDLSTSRRSTGSMTITKTQLEGGVFDSQFTVFPVFRFTRQCDGKEKVLDVGAFPWPPEILEKITLHSRNSPWVHAAPKTLRLHTLNDNFVPGMRAVGGGNIAALAEGEVDEQSLSCSHTVAPPPSCNVTISQTSECLSLGDQRTFSAHGSPGGGTYHWTITQGSGQASIVSGANQQTVTVRGTSTSQAARDITLQVQYQSPGGGVCLASIWLTTIEVKVEDFRFMTGEQFDPLNEVTPQQNNGGRHLGTHSPGNPPGCTGFFKKVELKVKVTPNVSSNMCAFRFRQERQGREGTLLPNGTFVPLPNGNDCPAPGWCADHPLNVLGQDVTLSSASTIFMVDAPGIDTPSGSTLNQVFLQCFNFRVWVEVDGRRCTNDFRWFASTRIKGTGTTWVLDNSGGGNDVGPGSIPECVPALPRPVVEFDVQQVVEFLESKSGADRIQAADLVASTYQSGLLNDADRDKLVPELLRIASQPDDKDMFYPPVMLAIELLSLLKVEEAIDVFMMHLLTNFPRSIVNPQDSPPATVASRALVRLGDTGLQAMIEKASSASVEEWSVLEHTLRTFEQQELLRRTICRALDTELSPQAEARLDQFLRSPTGRPQTSNIVR